MVLNLSGHLFLLQLRQMDLLHVRLPSPVSYSHFDYRQPSVMYSRLFPVLSARNLHTPLNAKPDDMQSEFGHRADLRGLTTAAGASDGKSSIAWLRPEWIT